MLLEKLKSPDSPAEISNAIEPKTQDLLLYRLRGANTLAVAPKASNMIPISIKAVSQSFCTAIHARGHCSAKRELRRRETGNRPVKAFSPISDKNVIPQLLSYIIYNIIFLAKFALDSEYKGFLPVSPTEGRKHNQQAACMQIACVHLSVSKMDFARDPHFRGRRSLAALSFRR